MFKESFKYYKSKKPPPNLRNVIDFGNIDYSLEKVKSLHFNKSLKYINKFILKSTDSWEVFELADHPGLIFIKNPFTSIGQRYWSVRCLQDYSRKPNKTNLDALGVVPDHKEWWEMCQNNSNIKLLGKMRWVTLGYHHNWDTKEYNEDDKGIFPKDLAELSKFIAEVLGFSNFNAEAAIVNFYQMDSTLSGHTDYSENNLEAPLISLSFGQTAIFLIGGKTKDEDPTAIFIRSGDIIVMSSESRTCYHAVPKILQMDSRYWNDFDEDLHGGKDDENKDIIRICKEPDLWKPFWDYLSHSRININIRQVLKRGQKRLSDECDN